MTETLTPKERYDAEKRARDLEHAGAARVSSGKKLTRSLLWSFVTIAILGGIAYWLWGVVQSNSPQGQDVSRAIPIQGQQHIPIGSEHEPYNSNPPTSGPHYERPARVGFYETSFPDERLVHNLEHGDVWISYRENVSSEDRGTLAQFADNPKVIVTLRAENEWDISLAAWGRLDGFNLEGAQLSAAERQRIKDFILRYQNQAPEKVLDSGAHLED